MTVTAPTAADLGINPTGERFYAARSAGRYRVFDTDTASGDHVEVAVCSSRGKAEEKAAKLNAALSAEEPVIVKAGEAAPLAEHDAPREESWGTPPVPPMKPCDATCCPAEAVCATRDAASPPAGLLDENGHLPEFAEPMTEGEQEEVAVAILGPVAKTATAAEKPKAVRFHGPIHRLLLTVLPDSRAAAVAPLLARLADATTLTDGGRSISTVAAERAALREVVEGWLSADEALTVRERRSLTALLASQWMTA